MKTKDITPLTVVYGHQTTSGDRHKAVVLSTAVWAFNAWAARMDQKVFALHENRPAAKFGVTVGALAYTAPLDTPDAELLAAAAAVDIDQVAATGAGPTGVEVVMTKDVVLLAEVLAAELAAQADKAAREAETLARRGNARKIRELTELLDLDLPTMHSGGQIPMGHATLAALLERLARAEGKLS